jgi:hypothetical protein
MQAGFQLLVAMNVFIHHFGSRTFAGLKIDGKALLQENFQRFHDKWGPEHSNGYRRPFAGQAPAPGQRAGFYAVDTNQSGPRSSTPQRVSLCMIVKNEEDNLADCLNSIRDLVDEMVVVDTGSTDRTREIAQSLGAKVFEFPWCDHFAAARNESIRHATGDWIFWLDADDRIDEANRQKLRQLFASLTGDNIGYSLKCACLPDPVNRNITIVDHVRLFRNHPQIRWSHRVHEQILPAIRQQGGKMCFTPVVIQHVGYVDRALRHRKLQRDLRLLILEREELGDHPFTLFNLGSVYLELGQPEVALPLLERSLERSHVSDSIVRKLYALIGSCHRRMDQLQHALESYQRGRQHYPDDGELLLSEGLMHLDLGNFEVATNCFRRLLSIHPEAHFASVIDGLYSYQANHHLGLALARQGRFSEAESCWRLALQENPRFLLSWRARADLYSQHGRWQELWDVIGELERLGEEPMDLLRLRQSLPAGWRPAPRAEMGRC